MHVPAQVLVRLNVKHDSSSDWHVLAQATDEKGQLVGDGSTCWVHVDFVQLISVDYFLWTTWLDFFNDGQSQLRWDV